MEGTDPNNNKQLRISGTELLLLSAVSTVLYVIIALLIFYFFHDQHPVEVILRGLPVFYQLLAGIGFGLLAAVVVGFFTYNSPISDILRDFAIIDFVANIRLTLFDRVQISFFAGTGEEFLFRGAVQPLLGVWWTSIIFVALHGYFHFKSIGHIMFGIMMFTLSVGLGFLFEWVGLIAAMTAHAVYDFVLLQATAKWGLPDSMNHSTSRF